MEHVREGSALFRKQANKVISTFCRKAIVFFINLTNNRN